LTTLSIEVSTKLLAGRGPGKGAILKRGPEVITKRAHGWLVVGGGQGEGAVGCAR